VVFFFLRNLRSTIIAAVAIPVSLIGTFAVMKAMGMTLNNMTLLALSLATGIVIDDAIVVLENVFRYVEEKGLTPREAASQATEEIGLAVLATTLSLVVIFLPVIFITGQIGQYLLAFGIVSATAIMLSMFISFTLTPAMCATWLRSTDFGDTRDRVLVRSDGATTYLCNDFAYHRDKFARGFDLLINVWGADHHGYIARMKAAMQALGHDPDELEVAVVQLVALMKGGEPVKLSKRAGDIVELADVLDEVGPDAARLTYLLQSIDSPQTFDIDVVTSEGNDNPVFYVQMAYSRIRSIKRVAAERSVDRLPLGERFKTLSTHVVLRVRRHAVQHEPEE